MDIALFVFGREAPPLHFVGIIFVIIAVFNPLDGAATRCLLKRDNPLSCHVAFICTDALKEVCLLPLFVVNVFVFSILALESLAYILFRSLYIYDHHRRLDSSPDNRNLEFAKDDVMSSEAKFTRKSENDVQYTQRLASKQKFWSVDGAWIPYRNIASSSLFLFWSLQF